MTEQKVKKRGWVKNAAIIFLAVMLVLTFFSNTIMNYSLPEAAAQYVQSGEINAKIRGTGPVTAMESYEVKSEQTREVLSVPVQVGDTVKVGDTLILFSDAESSQLKEAEAALDALVLTYQQALLDNSGNYTKENRAIQTAQQAYDKAKAKIETLTPVSAADIAAAKANLNRAKNDYNVQQAIVTNLENQLNGLNAPSDNSSAITAANSAVTAAQAAYDAAMLAYKTGYDNLTKCATAWKNAPSSEAAQKSIAVCMDALAQKYKEVLKISSLPAWVDSGLPAFPTGTNEVKYDTPTITAMVTAYEKVNPLEDTLQTAKDALSSAYASTGGDYNYYTVKNQLAAAKTTLATYQNTKENYDAILTDLTTKDTEYDNADTAVTTAQNALQTAMDALADKKIADGKAGLTLANQRKQISDKKEDLAKLQKGGEGASVVSKVNGKVSTISVSAGKMTTADSAIMVIEVPDMGYGVSFSVTTEQSKKVAVGDAAEITNYYSEEPLTATLIGIKSDTKNPATNKTLNFKLQGEVESGISLSLSIGERGGNYDTIVPNSAIRSDNNGKFVLAVIAKNSPLGNRYIATRIDVKVITSDDVNTAVSGGLSTSDRVITTSTKPVEPGTQVRLPD